jgi:hypothetical protein
VTAQLGEEYLMANEPVLSKHDPNPNHEWITYLQQLLSHYKYWEKPADGVFSDDLEAAVITLQKQCNLAADGVVNGATWARLTGAPAEGKELHGTSEGGEETQLHGLVRAYKYTFPEHEIAALNFGEVELKLTLNGEVIVKFPHSEGVTLSADGWSTEVHSALNGITQEIEVTGADENHGLYIRTAFVSETEFGPNKFEVKGPNEYSYSGTMGQFSYEIECPHTPAEVEGSLTYEVDVKFEHQPGGGGEALTAAAAAAALTRLAILALEGIEAVLAEGWVVVFAL